MGWGSTALVLLEKSRLVGQAYTTEAISRLRWLEITAEQDLGNAAVPWETPAQFSDTEQPAELAGGGGLLRCPQVPPEARHRTGGTPGYQPES